MQQRLSRIEKLIGTENLMKLQNTHVLIVGLGGVGGYALEALARSGVMQFTLVDSDRFEQTNMNRQILCTANTVGMNKTDVAVNRIHEIDTNIKAEPINVFLDSNSINRVFNSKYDIVIDAIDSVESKICLLKHCIDERIPVVSSMGAGFRLNPTLIRTGDISETFGDPLAKTVRKKLSEYGITNGIQCVFSTEKPQKKAENTIASSITVTGCFGFVLAQLAINTITSQGI